MSTSAFQAILGRAKRVVVKVGSSSLTRPDGHLSAARLHSIVEALAEFRKGGREVVLVSSGAQAAAMGPLKLKSRPRTLAAAQAAASVGQGLLIAEYARAFGSFGLRVGQVLLTAEDVLRRGQYRNASRALEQLLSLNVVPVINENDTVATDEIRFGDNDRLAALVAHLVSADLLVLLSDVDALYTQNPSSPSARRVPVISSFDQVQSLDTGTRGSALGTGGMISKISAAAVATSSGIPVLLTAASRVNEAFAGADIGTWFEVTGKRLAPRQLWLAYAADVNGQVIVDDGAARAVTQRNASLLPAGVVEARGEFRAGDVVEICDLRDRVLARGQVGFGKNRLADVIGRSIAEIEAEHGHEYAHEVVHRDELVVMARHRRATKTTDDSGA